MKQRLRREGVREGGRNKTEKGRKRERGREGERKKQTKGLKNTTYRGISTGMIREQK